MNCGIFEWQGKPLTLDIDHVDGNPLNCLLSNLHFLCPNCHAQTESNLHSKSLNPYFLTEEEMRHARKEITARYLYDVCACGKQKQVKSIVCKECSHEQRKVRPKKIEWPPAEKMQALVEQYGYRGAGRALNVSDSAIRKHLKTPS